nr:uncharacterized protein LOC104098016 [Nicotiana tomentosiformis]
MGELNSVHNRYFKMMLDLSNQAQSILTSFDKQSEKTKGEYRVRLNASIDVARYLLKEGMSIRGHDERETSTRRGNFLDLLKWYANKKDDVKKVVLENAPKNDIIICPNIEKDIVSSCAKETLKAIVEDLNGDYFGILVDESKDVSHKKQMTLILHYVNKEGKVIERFLSIVHVKDTSAKSLKEAIYSFLLEHSLSKSQIRKQGYDGASNMRGGINGLKTLIMNDTPSAYCIHYFAHQLQLTLIRKEMLRDDQAEKLEELLVLGEVHTGSGLNQEFGLQRADQDIVSAMKLVGFAKRQLQDMRDSRWNSLIKDVCLFYVKHDIVISEMDMNYIREKSKHKKSSVTYFYHLRVEVFYAIIDLQLSELNNHFNEVNTNLLLGMASLSPDNSFANYDKDKIIKLATHYPNEFTDSIL